VAPVSRRSVLHGLLATSVGGALGGCGALTGFATTGGSGMTFFSTQFTPVEEAERFRGVLRTQVKGDVSYVTSDPGPFATQVRTQVDAGSVRASLLGGVHGDLVPFADGYLTDLTDLLDGLGDLGWPPEFLELARAGTSRTSQVFGASAWWRRWHVTPPMIRPSLQVALILRTILAIQVFAVAQALTGRNFPLLVGETYQWYVNLQNASVASALALVVLAISLVVSIVYLRALRRERA
jgi:Binding-protein-dependent transport system inner membrane component